jgi:hypothetical protein
MLAGRLHSRRRALSDFTLIMEKRRLQMAEARKAYVSEFRPLASTPLILLINRR